MHAAVHVGSARNPDAGTSPLRRWTAPLDDPRMPPSRALQVVALATIPAIVGAVLFVGGGQVRRCLALTCPPPPPRPTYPLIGTTDPALALTGLLALVWIVLALANVGLLSASDRPRLTRLLAVFFAMCTVVAVVAAIASRLDGNRWRTVAESAGLSAAAVAYLILPPLLAWAAATRRRT